MGPLWVELGERRYPIHVGRGLVARLPVLLGAWRGRRGVVVSNPRIWSLHGQRVARGLRKLGRFTPVLVPAGERHKSALTLARLHDAFLAAGLARDGCVVAVGGGVVGDLTGFAAATYMRGVDYVQVPTTLLAMVDSSIGGKVGVNHPKAKNLIGAFHQPRTVVVDPALLASLPAREARSGAYEILKCGVLADPGLFSALAAAPYGLRRWDHAASEAAIAAACRIKAEIVAQDERESGLRRVLNLGHTLGHAFEAVTGYRRFTHGEAVGWGLIGAAWLAWRRGLLRETRLAAIAEAVDHLGPRPRVSDLAPQALLAALRHDKKVKDGKLHFVLPEAIGRVVIRNDVTTGDVLGALRFLAARELG